MPLSDLLEDFSGVVSGNPVNITDISLEEERLAAFEKGYQSGWDDAARAQTDDSRHVSADFAQNLRDLSFTYHEAYVAVMSSLKPLLAEMADTVLPDLARKSLTPRIVETLHDMAKANGPGEFELVASPANMPALEAMTDELADLTLRLTEEATLGPGQVFIRLGQHEREIDLDGALKRISQAVETFFETSNPPPVEEPLKESA